MSSIVETTNGDWMIRAIQDAIKSDLDKLYEEEKERVLKRLDDQKAETIARIALRLSEQYSVENLGKTIRIEIKNER